ncbi:MAG: TRAP transporter large permease subunit [Candidatus Neomarinimicrobiota bacterium]
MADTKDKTYFLRQLEQGESIIALFVYAGIVLIPVIEALTRLFNVSIIAGAPIWTQHLTLWVAFIGAMIASQNNKLLSLTSKPLFIYDRSYNIGKFIAKTASIIIVISLMIASIELIKIEFQYPVPVVPGVPRWLAQIIMPIGFGVIAIQLLYLSSNSKFYRSILLIVTIFWFVISYSGMLQELGWPIWIFGTLILVSLVYGMPIFIGLGGIAVLLFWKDFTPITAIPAETYRIVVSPSLPTIPLFTLVGFILAESGASRRMMTFFQSAFSWIPGGTPIIVVILSGFFTAMTGGSGVTILALGGLLYPMLRKEGYSEMFSLGLITVAGSLGLLFPPSLPLIIYSVSAGVSVKDAFVAGLIPGTLLIVLIGIWAVYQGKVQKIERLPFEWKKVFSSTKESIWEILIPIFILLGIFTGYMTLVETAAALVIYVLIIEIYIYKDFKWKNIPKIIIDCTALIGGVLIILGVAMGLTSYLVDAQIPLKLLAWVKTAISSKYVFLLLLNILLLAVGSLMDIFSAIIVFVPLLAPLGEYFEIHPVHMAIIFIANLELGFITPPVGMNLFLSAYRFEKPMSKVYRSTLPFFVVRLLAVLAITYIPIISLGFLN